MKLFLKFLMRMIFTLFLSAIALFFIAVFYPAGVLGAFELFGNLLR